ncbi:MAG: hypothetical protein HQL74_15525 [Magnetococcales bacterium]|nr:hypothetical protein [Magnetococcales bacterium]
MGQWKEDFIAAGTSGLAAGKRLAGDNAKQLAALESAGAERDRVIGKLTIANVILKKSGAVLPSMTCFRQELTAMCQSNTIVRHTKVLALLNISRSSWYHRHVGQEERAAAVRKVAERYPMWG